MKNTIIISFILLVALSSKAQSPVISLTEYYTNNFPYSENIYIKDIEGLFNPFIGTWKWQDGNTSLTVLFFKTEMVYQNDSKVKRYRDKLYGKIRYVKNGREVFNTLINGGNTLENRSGMPKNNVMYFSFKDPVKAGKYGEVYITLLDNNTKIKFYLVNNEGPKSTFPGEPPFDWEFSMPRRTEFVLNKL